MPAQAFSPQTPRPAKAAVSMSALAACRRTQMKQANRLQCPTHTSVPRATAMCAPHRVVCPRCSSLSLPADPTTRRVPRASHWMAPSSCSTAQGTIRRARWAKRAASRSGCRPTSTALTSTMFHWDTSSASKQHRSIVPPSRNRPTSLLDAPGSRLFSAVAQDTTFVSAISGVLSSWCHTSSTRPVRAMRRRAMLDTAPPRPRHRTRRLAARRPAAAAVRLRVWRLPVWLQVWLSLPLLSLACTGSSLNRCGCSCLTPRRRQPTCARRTSSSGTRPSTRWRRSCDRVSRWTWRMARSKRLVHMNSIDQPSFAPPRARAGFSILNNADVSVTGNLL
eukprot:m.8628 g.8628  ORF g.8628 m.8628 type:complete len:335 (-) comp2555_c0_seq1:197-1201(-)